MQIIREYVCETTKGIVNYYAVIELDDGSRVELSSQCPRDKEAWLASAAAYQLAIADPEPTLEVEAEDGTVV